MTLQFSTINKVVYCLYSSIKLIHFYMFVNSFHVPWFHILPFFPVVGLNADAQFLIKFPGKIKSLLLSLLHLL